MPLLREGESGQLIQGTATGDVLTWDESDQEWFAEPVSGLGITTDDVDNVSSVPGATATGAFDNLKGRIDGLTSSLISNVSTVAGATVTAALDTLKGLIAALTTTLIANVSTVPGMTATDALNFLVTRGGYGAQLQWAIDPATGNDSNSGTPASPLRTMAQFNARMAYTQITAGAVTLQLVGDVTDKPLSLVGTGFASGSTLTVSGTVTQVATPTITGVVTLETNAAFQLTTTGIVWSAANVGQRLVLPTGQVGWVAEFVDANNVITGPFVNTAGTAVAPSNGGLTVQTLSAALAPSVQGATTTTATVVLVKDVSISSSFTIGQFFSNGIPLGMFACKIGTTSAPTALAQIFMNFIACGFFTAGLVLRGAGSWLGVTWVNGASQLGLECFQQSDLILGPALFSNSPIILNEASLCRLAGRLHIRNTANPIQLAFGSIMSQQNQCSGSVGNTGIGIKVGVSCRWVYPVAGFKPTLTGASDTQIGNTVRTYAQIPYVDLQLDAVPPTVTTLVGTPAAMVQSLLT
jgi:hypothetical protein